ANMWKEISPKLKTKYVKLETNLGEMRNTLTVVAALLATITFAAGFTLPGGLNEKTGDAILAKKVVTILYKVLAKLPKANKDPIQFLEEGRPASASGNDDSQTAFRNSLSTKKILDQEDQVLLLEEGCPKQFGALC
ncbi:Ankyrin repeat-containing protein ITN1, partial [Bienertia sinuspersici]